MVGLVVRVLIVAVVTVIVSVAIEIRLIEKFNASPVGGPAIIVLTALAVVVSYLHWRPRYRVV